MGIVCLILSDRRGRRQRVQLFCGMRISAVLMEISEEWETNRKYVTMDPE